MIGDVRSSDRDADVVERRALAVQIHPDHRPGPIGEGGTDQLRVDQEPVVVAVHEHRAGAGPMHGAGRGDERVGRKDDLVAGADAETAQNRLDRIGSVGHTHAVVDLAVGRELILERRDFAAADEGRVADDSSEAASDLVVDLIALGGQVEEGDVPSIGHR